jgi:Mrp family chromosome partitioning ATPase/predicted Fe-Mo cluster-binding NifX family protein
MTKEPTQNQQDQIQQMEAEQEQINKTTKHIKHKILVLSGKGGVGKSSVAVNLAVWLAMQGQKVGLLDVDIHGPSVPKLLKLEGRRLEVTEDKIEPVLYSSSLKVMSVGFLIPNENAALIWRGPMKHGIIKKFVSEVVWGELDYLIVDCPPGTGDEPLSVVQVLGQADGAVVVTTPQQLAVTDVKKCITFCKQLNLPVLGVIENMSGFVCPHCNKRTDIFGNDGGKKMCREFDVPFLGSVPLDSAMVPAGDSGEPFIYFNGRSPTAQALEAAFEPLLQLNKETGTNNNKEDNKMKIAIPLAQGQLCLHFGHCEQFAIIDVNEETGEIANREDLTPPPHEPGVLPQWLHEKGVNVIIAGGMGQRAQQLFDQNNIKVVVGASSGTPEELIGAYLNDTLETGDNICDH